MVGRLLISYTDMNKTMTHHEFQENLIERNQTPLFEMMLERPPHMYTPPVTNDINVVPDDNTGMDYEQLSEQRKYDSDNDEFEIL